MTNLKCYVSASFDIDLSSVIEILQDNYVEVYEFYDGSISTSFQDILKRKLRQVDFAVFIILGSIDIGRKFFKTKYTHM